ncbi:MAG TPA: carboxypeptidase-like regulatory domain-containing protein [Flavisolibacter sp.]|nr:carboxypeptidase-like regulatory domain-containing protein [Flavisolibacter sp.]
MTRIYLLQTSLFFLLFFASCKKSDTEGGGSSAKGVLKGIVYSPNGEVPLASVTLETFVNGNKVSTASDKDGTFALELPAGNYNMTMYSGAGAHFSTQKNFRVEAGKTTDVPASQSRLSFTGKIGYVKGLYDEIESLVHEMGIETTELSLSDMTDYNIVKQYDLLLLNCMSGYIDFETNKILDRYLKEGHSIYASDMELQALSAQDWGFIPASLLSYNTEGKEGIIEGTVLFEPFKKALGKSKMEIEFDLPMYVQVTNVAANDQRFKVLVSHPQKGPLALNIQWGPARTSAQGIPYGGNIIYTTFHDAILSNDVKAVLRQMILQL